MKDLRILGIDTSGKVASVAITDGERLVWEKSVYTKLTHSQVILPMVEQALSESGFELSDIDCAAVANGPGSYTGLRIGIGAVKGMCEGCKSLGCAGVSTLLALAYNCVSFRGRIIAVMRARPDISYVGEFRSDSRRITRINEDRVAKDSEVFSGLDTSVPVMLTGDNAQYIRQKFFDGNDNVITANAANVLQRAGSLCLAVQADEALITSADKLEVSYLQATKAEKDKAHSDRQEEEK
jgi:tRNA threonylcarbamoyladenosine biosynthesis protein TsaB